MIELRNITKVYKNGSIEISVLKKVSFTIRDGEFVAIMGPSGSGKSTLMHILGALDSPTSGSYFLDQDEISLLDERALADIRRKKIGFVFQSFHLLSRATVLRNVLLPLIYAGIYEPERTVRAKEALKSAGLEEERHHHFSNQLSGGQMQRVAIARALVNKPSMILADEPTGNLDTQTGDVVLKTFQALKQKGHTIVLITHERDVAMHAERIIHLRDGRITHEEIIKSV